MEYINFSTPPFPHFIIAGSALYRPGDIHGRRSNIGVFDLIYIESGELYITDGNTSWHLKEKEILIIKPDSTHYGHKKVNVKSTFKWVHFRTAGKYFYTNELRMTKEEMKSIGSYTDRRSIVTLPVHKKLSDLESNEVSAILSKLSSAVIDKYQQTQTQVPAPPSPLERQELFLRLLGFLQLYQAQYDSSEFLAANIMEYILQNVNTDLNLEKIASHFNFHPVHIIRCMKKEYGSTPNKIITQVRINNAKNLLITSDFTINRISEISGFSSPSYFNRVFRKQTGMTPKEYRDTHKLISNLEHS